MKTVRLAVLVLATTIANASAGAWPDVGDRFRLDDDTLLVVMKIKRRGDVDHSLVCMHRSGTRAQDRSCNWAKVGDLHGHWITYEGVPRNEN